MPEPSTKRAFWQAVSYAWQFGYTIVVPLVVFAVVGRMLDTRLGTHPWLFIGGVILAIAASTVLLVRKAMQIVKTLNPSTKDGKDDTQPPKDSQSP